MKIRGKISKRRARNFLRALNNHRKHINILHYHKISPLIIADLLAEGNCKMKF